ncbi:MAG TPA: sodium:solute symporter [Candidatus Baltobacteraceae bacterium]|nr:sodium:solute symporter [Candidatus Baltobacteraceae bacterium]
MNSGTAIFIALVLAVTVMGFLAARWGNAKLNTLDEWALGGRRFGTLVSWFLLGGDLYTAYTFIAVPALAFGAGALAFFAVPYTTIAYPLVFLIMARFWSIAKRRGYVTTADFVHDRFGSRWLELAVAVTGVLSVMPYIALQLTGMQAVLERVGIASTNASALIFLVVAFVLLAAYTFTSGLRAPAMIAFVKDALIYLTVIVALAIIPAKLGGWAHIFDAAQAALAAKPKPGSIILTPNLFFAYSTLAFGSALALFIYPHSVTSVLSAKSAQVIQRNCALLPLYSLLLTFIALLGYCALAAHISVGKQTNLVIPQLFAQFFPNWFAGIAFAAIVIGALVPAAIMAIGAANLVTSNILQSFRARQTRPASEFAIARYIALLVLAGGFAIAVFLRPQFAINFQLLGGAWILQVFPAVILGLYTRWFHPAALLLGWAAGMAAATWMAVSTNFATFYPLHIGGGVLAGANMFYAFIVNLAVAALLTLVFNAVKANAGSDLTTAADYA